MQLTSHLLFPASLVIVLVICVKTGKLSITAALAAALVAIFIYTGAGLMGLLLLGTFFVLGTLATAHGKKVKAAMAGEAHPEKRTAGQVFANGGVAALMALQAFLNPDHESVYRLMLAGSCAAATADTLSSELGVIYGRHTFNILTFKKEPAGLDGVISREGTLLGAAGALLIGIVYGLMQGFDSRVLIIGMAGVCGNIADSVLGASLERKKLIGNNTVNWLNTLTGACTALILYQLYR